MENYLAYAFNLIHKDGMTALWKNSPYLSSWGRHYADGAVVEEWVGEAEYTEDDYVCDPGQKCPAPRSFAAFCTAVYSPPYSFAAVKFDVDLDGRTFYACPA